MGVTPLRDGFIEVDGLRLHHVEWGSRGRPLLLLHGLQDCALSWGRFAAALSADYRVIALDQRGHGDSDWAAPGSYLLQDFVSDVEAFVDRMALDALILLGHGAGGRNAIAYAAVHPGKVEALIVVDSGLDGAGPRSRKGSKQSTSELEEWDSLEAVVEHLRGLQPNSTAETLARQASCLTREITGGRRAWKRDPALLAAYEQPDLWEEWRKVKCPTLLARGRQSEVLRHQEAVEMRESLLRVRLAELEGGGHWFHQEIPGAFEATVRWFLQNPPE